VLNSLVLTPLAFTTFRTANQPFEVFAHLVLGTLLSFAFLMAPAAASPAWPSGSARRARRPSNTDAGAGADWPRRAPRSRIEGVGLGGTGEHQQRSGRNVQPPRPGEPPSVHAEAKE
jgi:hypothetical protein